MSENDEIELGALRDGELAARSRRALSERLEREPELGRALRELDGLGEGLRRAHAELPVPRIDHVIARLRPALLRVDAELEAERARRPLARLSEWLRPGPAALLAAAAAVVLLAVIPSQVPPGLLGGNLANLGLAPAQVALEVDTRDASSVADAFELGAPGGVYDFSSQDAPVMLYEATDGSTVIWFLEDDGVSWAGSEQWA